MIRKPPLGPFVLVDTETTGLDPSRHEIIQIGVLIGNIDEEGGMVYEIWEQKILPVHIELADQQALKVSNYQSDVWKKEARSAAEVYPLIDMFLENCSYVGYNSPFDLAFLRAGFALECLSFREPKEEYDIYREVGRPLAYRHNIPATLDSLCKQLEISEYQAHDALGDAKREWVLMWTALQILSGEKRKYDLF